MLAASATDMDTKFALQRSEASLQRANDACGDPGRMPVHAHYGAERLEPERMRQPPQGFVAAILMHDRLRDDRAKRGHARRKPRRHASAMKRKVSVPGASSHSVPNPVNRAAAYQNECVARLGFISAMVRNVME